MRGNQRREVFVGHRRRQLPSRRAGAQGGHALRHFRLKALQAVVVGLDQGVETRMRLRVHGFLPDEGRNVRLQRRVADAVAHLTHAVHKELLSVRKGQRQGGQQV